MITAASSAEQFALGELDRVEYLPAVLDPEIRDVDLRAEGFDVLGQLQEVGLRTHRHRDVCERDRLGLAVELGAGRVVRADELDTFEFGDLLEHLGHPRLHGRILRALRRGEHDLGGLTVLGLVAGAGEGVLHLLGLAVRLGEVGVVVGTYGPADAVEDDEQR